MTKASQWKRFRDRFLNHDALGISLDLSRVRWPDGFPERMRPEMEGALDAMAGLEAGALANPDEGRMVGHYWLRAPELAPDETIGTQVREAVTQVRDFAAGVHAGEVLAGTSLTYEIWDGSGWVQCYDGDLIGVDNSGDGGGDLSGVPTTEPWDVRATLTPDTNAYRTPAIKRFGVREIVKTDLTGVATVEGGQVQVDPMSLKGEITKATVKILKTGERDYRDYGTEILTANHIGEIELRLWMGDPTGTYLNRSEWMLLHTFEIDDYVNGDASHEITCVSPMRRLRRDVPAFELTGGTDGTREPKVYTNETPKAVYTDLLENLGELPTRYIGPGIEDEANTSPRRSSTPT